jgi:ribokinase
MSQGLNVTGVRLCDDASTGSASVFINPEGENSIVVLGGANAWLTADDVKAQATAIETADIVLCQMETTLEATVTALERAAELGKTTMLNPSPLIAEFPWGKTPVDFLIANEREAAALLGYFVESTVESAQIRAAMADLGVSTLIITRGAQPTFVFSAHQALKIPPPIVEVVDTVGAGDAFAGAFAVHWAQSHNLLQSLRKANIAGAITTTRAGAQYAIPTREEVDSFGKPAPESTTEDALVPVPEAGPPDFAEADEQI